MAITIYGASDDLIEVDGDISEEFGYRYQRGEDDEGDLLAFSDGTVLRIVYSDAGIWRISPVVVGSSYVGIDQVPETEEDPDDYSDKATLSEASWVVHGTAYAVAKS